MVLFSFRLWPIGHLLSAGMYGRRGWYVVTLYVLRRDHSFMIPLPVRALEAWK